MKSTKPIAAGEEIFNDYGELPRGDLLRRYGYVTDNYAKYDVVEIPLQKLCDFTGVKHTSEPGPDNPQVGISQKIPPSMPYMATLTLSEAGVPGGCRPTRRRI